MKKVWKSVWKRCKFGTQHCSGHYPDTRSGRGHGSGQSTFARGSPHIPVSPLSLPVQTHTAQLRIPCAHCHSTMIAKITFDFHEDSATEADQVPGAPKEKSINTLHLTPTSDILKHKEPCSSEIPDTSHPVDPSDSKHGVSVGRVEH